MKSRQTLANAKKQPALVRCCDCALSIRDTSGPSFNIVTHEFFMGSCPLAHADGRVFYDPDGHSFGKVFMDKSRVCTDFKPHQRSE